MQKVYIIEDNDGARNLLKELVATSGIEARSFPDAQEFLDQFNHSWVGCIVTDVRMPRISGIALQEILRKRDCNMPIIFISGYADVSMAVDVMKSGAFDFFEKPFSNHALLESINRAFVLNTEIQANEEKKVELEEKVSLLTKREHEVMECLMTGKKNKDVAELYDISVRTVEVHRQRLLNKLNVKSVADLILKHA